MSGYSSPISLRGPQGVRGALFSYTAGPPTDSNVQQPAMDGDAGFDEINYIFYQRVSGSWQSMGGTVKGVKGDTGAQGVMGIAGSRFEVGSGSLPAANDTTYNTGDHYALAPGYEVYVRNADGTWADTGSTIKGVPGIRGSQRFVGNGPPPSDQSTLTNGNTTGGVAGDVYEDQSTAGGPYLYNLT